jgi:two-component system CheB/CheR fusion protein
VKQKKNREEFPFDEVLTRIRDARNFDFREYKRGTLTRRIERRMGERRCRSVREYLDVLDGDPGEFDALLSAMLIKVTSFFRDPDVWEEISKKILPELVASRQASDELRVWVAGCATGEEAFSIAILIAEALGPAFGGTRVKIFGTDVDEAAIAVARRGGYDSSVAEAVPKALLDKWFVHEGGGWTVKQEIRRTVVFGVNNLVSDAPISRLDLVLCRNVFIYLDAALQKRVLTRFHYALRREGMLVLGKAELIPFAASLFEPVDLARRVYRKDGRRDVPLAGQERLLGLLEQQGLDRMTQQSSEEMSTLGQYYRDALDALPFPAVTTSLDGTVHLWNRESAKLWQRSEGDVVGKKLSSLGLPGLSGNVLIERTALVRDGRSEREAADGTMTPAGRSPIPLTVEVLPLLDASRERVGLLYLVSDVSFQRGLELEVKSVNEELLSANEKMQTSVEELRAANEELETTNEELQSANEELQTTNEELQSTNEELETTNEELNSSNSELDATNRELASRTEEMNILGLYQRTIIRSLTAAVVVIDAMGRVTSWNLAAERLLGLPESETVGQALWTLGIPALKRSLLQRIREAVTAGRALRLPQVEYELPTGGTGTATLAAIPLVESKMQLGAVVLFEDTTKALALARENEHAGKVVTKKARAKKSVRRR